MRNKLDELNKLLKDSPDSFYCAAIDAALAGSDEQLNQFLVSNDLWGGSGSIADQAGMANDEQDARRKVEEILISLGEEQLSQGLLNVRTEMWVNAFKSR